MLINDNLQIIYEKPLTAKIVCGFMVALILLIIFNCVTSYRDINNPLKSMQQDSIEQVNLKTSDLQKSLKVDVFGKYIPKQLADINIKPSVLDVHLLGVMYSADKQSSKVLLKFANGTEKTFKIGDLIPGGAKIIHILPDGVIIKRDNTLERINLPKNKLSFGKYLPHTPE